MKKSFVFTTLILFSVITFGQSIDKGNLIGLHVANITLQPNVSYNDYKEFFMNKIIPKINEVYAGDARAYLIEGIRGENEHGVGIIYVFKSEAIRDKYFHDNGSYSEFGEKILEELTPLMEEAEKFYKNFSTTYTDWIVQ